MIDDYYNIIDTFFILQWEKLKCEYAGHLHVLHESAIGYPCFWVNWEIDD